MAFFNSSHGFSGPAVLGDQEEEVRLNHNQNDEEEDSKFSSNPYDTSKRNLAHLTIKQIVSASVSNAQNSNHNQSGSVVDVDANTTFLVDGVGVYQVLLYGSVQSIRQQTLHTIVMLHDYTGRIPLRFWNANENELINNKLDKLKENTVIKVIGRIQFFNGTLEVNAFNFWTVEPHQMLEYAHFMIEAVYGHVFNTAPKQHREILRGYNVEEDERIKRQYDERRQQQNQLQPSPPQRQRMQSYNNRSNVQSEQYQNRMRPQNESRYGGDNNDGNHNYHRHSVNNDGNSWNQRNMGGQYQHNNRNYRNSNNQHFNDNRNRNNNGNEWNRSSNIDSVQNQNVVPMSNSDPQRDALQRRIYEIVKSVPDQSGCTKEYIARQMPNEPLPEISSIVDAMLEQNDMYTTVDNSHFRVTM